MLDGLNHVAQENLEKGKLPLILYSNFLIDTKEKVFPGKMTKFNDHLAFLEDFENMKKYIKKSMQYKKYFIQNMIGA